MKPKGRGRFVCWWGSVVTVATSGLLASTPGNVAVTLGYSRKVK